jgi:hypothetical protein
MAVVHDTDFTSTNAAVFGFNVSNYSIDAVVSVRGVFSSCVCVSCGVADDMNLCGYYQIQLTETDFLTPCKFDNKLNYNRTNITIAVTESVEIVTPVVFELFCTQSSFKNIKIYTTVQDEAGKTNAYNTISGAANFSLFRAIAGK